MLSAVRERYASFCKHGLGTQYSCCSLGNAADMTSLEGEVGISGVRKLILSAEHMNDFVSGKYT